MNKNLPHSSSCPWNNYNSYLWEWMRYAETNTFSGWHNRRGEGCHCTREEQGWRKEFARQRCIIPGNANFRAEVLKTQAPPLAGGGKPICRGSILCFKLFSMLCPKNRTPPSTGEYPLSPPPILLPPNIIPNPKKFQSSTGQKSEEWTGQSPGQWPKTRNQTSFEPKRGFGKRWPWQEGRGGQASLIRANSPLRQSCFISQINIPCLGRYTKTEASCPLLDRSWHAAAFPAWGDLGTPAADSNPALKEP